MRHQKHRLRLGRHSAARKALLRNMTVALFDSERIVTTLPKAKALRQVAEPLITLGKKGDLAARRRALQILPNKKIVKKLFDEIAPQYSERNGGYTRIIKLAPRHGDAAPLAIMELVGYTEKQIAAQEEQAAKAAAKGKGIRQRIKDKVKKGSKAKKDEAPTQTAKATKTKDSETQKAEEIVAEETVAQEETSAVEDKIDEVTESKSSSEEDSSKKNDE